MYTGVAKSLKNVGMDISALHFKNPLYCKGNEKHITDCVVQYLPANDNLCNDTMGVVTSLTCQTGISCVKISMLNIHVYYVDRSRTAHTQSCQQQFSRGKLGSACLCPNSPPTVQNQLHHYLYWQQ